MGGGGVLHNNKAVILTNIWQCTKMHLVWFRILLKHLGPPLVGEVTQILWDPRELLLAPSKAMQIFLQVYPGWISWMLQSG